MALITFPSLTPAKKRQLPPPEISFSIAGNATAAGTGTRLGTCGFVPAGWTSPRNGPRHARAFVPPRGDLFALPARGSAVGLPLREPPLAGMLKPFAGVDMRPLLFLFRRQRIVPYFFTGSSLQGGRLVLGRSLANSRLCGAERRLPVSRCIGHLRIAVAACRLYRREVMKAADGSRTEFSRHAVASQTSWQIMGSEPIRSRAASYIDAKVRPACIRPTKLSKQSAKPDGAKFYTTEPNPPPQATPMGTANPFHCRTFRLFRSPSR